MAGSATADVWGAGVGPGSDSGPGSDTGPTGGAMLAGTLFIQRVSTQGGLAPATGCKSAKDVGKKALVPYSTDYVFYR